MRGQRFTVDVDQGRTDKATSMPEPGLRLVSDIRERATFTDPKPPLAPHAKSSDTGFPPHKDRLRASRFKKSKHQDAQMMSPGHRESLGPNRGETHIDQSGRHGADIDASIDTENKRRLAGMSEDEIIAAREQVMSGLSPSLIEKLLKKANINSPSTSVADDVESIANNTNIVEQLPAKKVTFENAESSPVPVPPAPRSADQPREDLPPLHTPPDLQPVASKQPLPPLSDIHFPKAPAPPDLDPDDPNFLVNLHSTYFPSLPSDPSTLAWMKPVDPEEQASYSPSQEALPSSSLRFDFRGHLLPPRLSSQIPSTKGLHHHGHAPGSAGYTIPELSHLARSAVTSQRCIAYQTLGRILYRLGRGDFGLEGEDLCEGLWELMEKGKVLEGMIGAASKEKEGNRSVWATATDAVWLWQKGGGRRWKGR
ncbi:MAG: hypothetical protein Q9163_003048 [Psora crenata]